MRKILKSKNRVLKQKKTGRRQKKVYYVTVRGQRLVIPLNKAPEKQIQNSRRQAFYNRVRRRNKVIQLGQLAIQATGWVSVIAILALVVDDVCQFKGFLLASIFVLVCLPILLMTAYYIRTRF